MLKPQVRLNPMLERAARPLALVERPAQRLHLYAISVGYSRAGERATLPLPPCTRAASARAT